MTRAEFARAARERPDWPSVSLRHLGDLERGNPDRTVTQHGKTIRSLERIFADQGWELGSAERILAGGEPERPLPRPGEPWRSIVREGIEIGDLVHRINESQEFDGATKIRLIAILLGEPMQLELPINRHTA